MFLWLFSFILSYPRFYSSQLTQPKLFFILVPSNSCLRRLFSLKPSGFFFTFPCCFTLSISQAPLSSFCSPLLFRVSVPLSSPCLLVFWAFEVSLSGLPHSLPYSFSLFNSFFSLQSLAPVALNPVSSICLSFCFKLSRSLASCPLTVSVSPPPLSLWPGFLSSIAEARQASSSRRVRVIAKYNIPLAGLGCLLVSRMRVQLEGHSTPMTHTDELLPLTQGISAPPSAPERGCF